MFKVNKKDTKTKSLTSTGVFLLALNIFHVFFAVSIIVHFEQVNVFYIKVTEIQKILRNYTGLGAFLKKMCGF